MIIRGQLIHPCWAGDSLANCSDLVSIMDMTLNVISGGVWELIGGAAEVGA